MKKDLLLLSDFSRGEILELFDRTRELKEKRRQGIAHSPLAGKTLGMIFHKHSTRTRISFEVGMFELGGYPLFLTADQLQLKRENPGGLGARAFPLPERHFDPHV